VRVKFLNVTRKYTTRNIVTETYLRYSDLVNLLETNMKLHYLKTQSVPGSEHTASGL